MGTELKMPIEQQFGEVIDIRQLLKIPRFG